MNANFPFLQPPTAEAQPWVHQHNWQAIIDGPNAAETLSQVFGDMQRKRAQDDAAREWDRIQAMQREHEWERQKRDWEQAAMGLRNEVAQKGYEVGVWEAAVNERDGTIAALETRMDTVKTKLEASKASRRNAQAAVTKAQEDVATAKAALEAANRTSAAAAEGLREQLRTARWHVERLEEQAIAKERELAGFRKELGEARSLLKAKNFDLGNYKTELYAARFAVEDVLKIPQPVTWNRQQIRAAAMKLALGDRRTNAPPINSNPAPAVAPPATAPPIIAPPAVVPPWAGGPARPAAAAVPTSPLASRQEQFQKDVAKRLDAARAKAKEKRDEKARKLAERKRVMKEKAEERKSAGQ